MTEREKTLIAAVLAVMVLWGGTKMWGKYRDALVARQTELTAAQVHLRDARLELQRGQRAIERLEAWQQQSLPADRDVARSLYRTWLEERFKQAGLSIENTVAKPPRAFSTGTQSAVGYTITARGNIKATIALLYEFYRSAMLQQITRLQLRPAGDTSQLTVTLTAEALILPGATHEDQLPDDISDRLAKASVEEYVESIEGRNLFAVYRPPRPDPPPRTARQDRPPPPAFDHAKHARFTATVGPDHALQAWVTVRTTGEVLRLSEGDPIKVGEFEGEVVTIEARMLVVQTGDKTLHIKLGSSLRDGEELDGGDDTASAVEAESKET